MSKGHFKHVFSVFSNLFNDTHENDTSKKKNVYSY